MQSHKIIDVESQQTRTYMRYRANDFVLYLFSLVLTWGLIASILDDYLLRLVLILPFLYLAVFFVRRHGAILDAESLPIIIKGVLGYPAYLFRIMRSCSSRVLQAISIFCLALLLEYMLIPNLQGTIWVKEFPWWYAIWPPFFLVTAFRILILIAHLKRSEQVREILEQSPIRKMLAGVSIQNHIVHAFVTGFIAHLCMLVPAILFFSFLPPSYLREVLLLGGIVLWCLSVATINKLWPPKSGGTGSLFWRLARFRLLIESHEQDHHSRFHFAVFHGHHHDAIPSGLISAASGVGFLESAQSTVTWLDFLDSVILCQLYWNISIIASITGHQYIPGVFPYAKSTVTQGIHHVAHHYGSLRPLGIVSTQLKVGDDAESGYKNDNPCIRWYLDTVDRYESLSVESRERFLSAQGTIKIPRASR